MSNPYFRCKQFTVQQDKAAMKVCTDSCLFGAWVADYISRQKSANSILDIGAGTGILSLLLAQKNSGATIDAVETESLSVQQAKENCEQSLWKDNIHVHHNRIQDFFPGKEYDVIISNPPFYEDDLLSRRETKNIAHHHTGLTFGELITAVNRLLSAKGCFAVLLPCHRTDEFEKMAATCGLFVNKKALVKQTLRHSCFRSMCMFAKEKKETSQDEISIKDEHNQYTPAFTDLLKDYYLYL